MVEGFEAELSSPLTRGDLGCRYPQDGAKSRVALIFFKPGSVQSKDLRVFGRAQVRFSGAQVPSRDNLCHEGPDQLTASKNSHISHPQHSSITLMDTN